MAARAQDDVELPRSVDPNHQPLTRTEARTRPSPAKVEGLDAALEAVRQGNPEGAIAVLGPWLEQHPDDTEARLHLARALATVGDYDRAGLVLKEPKGSPKAPEVVMARSIMLRHRGRLEEARALLEKAIAEHPDALALRGQLLDVLVDVGKRDDPRARELMDELYDAYERGDADTADELLAVARAALARGTKGAFHDANMVLGEAEAAAPAAQGSWIADQIILERGGVFLEKYAARDAITTFELVLQRDAWQPDALAGLARVYVDSLQFAAAARAATEALQVNPGHPEAHAALARVALIEGRREEARRRITEQVLAVDPGHVSGLAVLAGLAILENRDADYEKWRDRALAVNPKNGRFFQELSEILGFLHLYPEADRILAEGVELAPEDPYVHGARGLNLLRLGDEERGREALQFAWKKDPFNERTKNLLDLYEQSIDKGYELRRTGDLVLRFPQEDIEFIEPFVAESVRWSRNALDQAYGTNAGALRLEFFEDPQQFSVRTVGVPSLGAVAVCFGPVITFIGPYSGMFNIENVIRHELGHVYAIAKSRGRVPRWFTEGLSEWESELADPAWARESAELLDRARRSDKLRDLHELELAFIRAESPAMMEVAYATAAYAVRYLGETYGRAKLVDMLEGYAQGKDTETLFVEVLGKDIVEVENEFESWFFSHLDDKMGGWHPAVDGQTPDERDALWQKARKQAGAKDFAEATRTLQELINSGGDGYGPRMLLADLLLAGPKPQAAARHLEAARKHHPESLPPLVKLAELARRSGDVAAEKAHITTALKIDGDSLDPAVRLLVLAVATDDADALKTSLRRARGIAPLHPVVLAARALEEVKAGDSKRALAMVDRALLAVEQTGGRGPADSFLVIALAAKAVGKLDDARALAKKALESSKLPKSGVRKLEAITSG